MVGCLRAVVIAAFLAAAGAGAQGCEGKHRPYVLPSEAVSSSLPGEVASQGEGGSGPEGIDQNLPLVGLGAVAGALGAECTNSAQCDSGNCANGVCCDAPCTELCAACNLPGRVGVCSPAPSDPECPPANCAGTSTECRILDQSQLELNCETFGVCRSSASCAPVLTPQGMPCQEGTGTCDGGGGCVVPGKTALGGVCSTDTDCGEGHCVVGAGGAKICCDSGCDGVCQTCNLTGRCASAPATDARCPAASCPADSVCRDYDDTVTSGVCVGFGQCRTAQDCSYTGIRPDGQCVCDASNHCTLAAGIICADNAECASSVCLATAEGDSVCCGKPCAAGLFCSSDGARCVACEGSQLGCEGDTQISCRNGATVRTNCANGCTAGVGCNAVPPVGRLCDAGRCAPPGVCQQDSGGQARCCARDCVADGKVCSGDGSCICPPGQMMAGSACLRQSGDPCTTGTQCQTGFCADGVCCAEACGAYCEQCQAGTGLCVAVAAGQQDTTCNNGYQCIGQRNGCRARNGQPCTTANGSECVSGNCEATAGGGTRVCCDADCSTAARPFCGSAGSGCTQCENNSQCGNGCNVAQGVCNALLPIGGICGSSSQCGNGGSCIADVGGQSRCCERNCSQQGQRCDAAGRCVDPDPLVRCGNFNCPVNASNPCCYEYTLSFTNPSSLSQVCGGVCPSQVIAEPFTIPVSCDSPDDCTGGAICCQSTLAGAGTTVDCQLPSNCDTSINFVQSRRVCLSPSISTPLTCPPGLACNSGAAVLPGWQFCSPPF